MIAPRLGADGVDDMIGVMLSGVPEWASFEHRRGVIELRTRDTGDSWTLAFGRMIGTSPESGTAYDLDGSVRSTNLSTPSSRGTPSTCISGCAAAATSPDSRSVATRPGPISSARSLRDSDQVRRRLPALGRNTPLVASASPTSPHSTHR